jgi:hypothetical protein
MEEYWSRVPWSREQSLKEKAEEAGVDFDRLMEVLAKGGSDTEMARVLGVPEELISNLRWHFETYGVTSVLGQD